MLIDRREQLKDPPETLCLPLMKAAYSVRTAPARMTSDGRLDNLVKVNFSYQSVCANFWWRGCPCATSSPSCPDHVEYS